MTNCLQCGQHVDFDRTFYRVHKNGSKRGSKTIGYICELCGAKWEAND